MSKLTLTPGPDWERYTRAREGLTLLGVVREGAAVGALALREADGRYVQVNGDFQRELGTAKVQRALRHQQGTGRNSPPPKPTTIPAPTVIVKKRRSLTLQP